MDRRIEGGCTHEHRVSACCACGVPAANVAIEYHHILERTLIIADLRSVLGRARGAQEHACELQGKAGKKQEHGCESQRTQLLRSPLKEAALLNVDCRLLTAEVSWEEMPKEVRDGI